MSRPRLPGLLAAAAVVIAAYAVTPDGVAASPATGPCAVTGQASSAPAASTDAPPIVSAGVAGDTLTLRFASGTPAFAVLPQPAPRFATRSGPVTLAGTRGARIVLWGLGGDGHDYVGPASLGGGGRRLRQVRELDDFEGAVSWGVGLARAGCATVTATSSALTFAFA